MSGALHYGALVTLVTEDCAFAYTKGFVENLVKLEDLEDLEELDFMGGVFRVLPQCSYSIQNNLLQSLKSPEFKGKVLKQEESLEGEIKTNIQTYSNLKGQPLRFGSVVQFQHLWSQKFLTLFSSENAEFEKDNLKVSLSDFPSEYSNFRIEPAFKFQKRTNTYVQFEDKVILEVSVGELGKPAYLHASATNFQKTFNWSMLLSKENSSTREVNASLDNKSVWKVCYFSEFHTKNCLNCKDYVWLTHSEKEVCLAANSKSLQNQNLKVYFTSNLQDTNALWRIERENETLGGVVSSKQVYRIKHGTTGLYLSVEGSKTRLSGKKDTYARWKVTSATAKNSVVSKDDICEVVNVETGLVLQGLEVEKLRGKPSVKPVLSEHTNEYSYFKVHKAEEELVWETLFILSCMPILRYFPVFIESQAHESTQRYSKYRQFQKYTGLLQKSLVELKQFCKNKLETMIKLGTHYGELQFSRQKLLKEQGFIDALAQILNSCFVGPFSLKRILKKPQNSKDLSQLQLNKMIQVVKSIYKLLTTICKSNQENQIYAFSFFRVFQKHAAYNLGASECMTSILENNETLLMKLHKPLVTSFLDIERTDESIISHYIWLLKKFSRQRKPELLKFLRSICKYKGKGLSINQEKLHEFLFYNAENHSKAVIPTITSEDQKHFLLTLLHSSGFGEVNVVLDECFNSGKIVCNNLEIEYFTRMLELFADMCKDRNYICKASIKDWFPVPTLLQNIWNPKLSPSIRAAFCNLMLNMHIDSYPRQEASRPELIRVLRLVSKEDEGMLLRRRHSLVSENLDLVHEVGRRFTTAKRSKVTPAPNTSYKDLLKFESEEIPLHSLKEKVLSYFQEQSHCPEFDCLTLSMLKLAYKMTKFELYGAFVSDPAREVFIMNPENPLFSYENMDLVRLLKSLAAFLFHSNEYSEFKRSRKSLLEVPSEEKEASVLQVLSEVPYEGTSDPIVRLSANFKNFLSSYLEKLKTTNKQKNFEILSKVKICELLLFVVSWRQDYLISNVTAWFNYKGVDSWNFKDLQKLLPPITKVPYSKKSNFAKHFERIPQVEFCVYQEPQIPELSCMDENTVPKLVELFTRSSSYKLQTLCLNLVFKCFSQREDLLRNVHKMHVMTLIQDTDLFSWTKSNLSTFKQHAEQSKLWLKYWQQSPYVLEKNLNKLDTVTSILEHFEDILYQDTMMYNGRIFRGEREVITKDRQAMLFYLNIHEYLVKLIYETLYVLEEVFFVQKDIKEKEAKIRLSNLCSICIRICCKFVQNNSKYQKCLFKYLPYLSTHLHLPAGQIDLISKVFKDNYELCSEVSGSFLQQFVDLIWSEGRQTRFLQLFETVQLANGEPIPDTQRLVLLTLLNSETRDHVLYMTPDSGFDFQESSSSENPFYKDQPFHYHAKLIKVLTNCGVGVSRVYLNEAKCQKIIPIDQVFFLLEQSEEEGSEFSVLKLPLLDFFFQNFLDCEKKCEEVRNHRAFVNYISFQSDVLLSKSSFSKLDYEFLRIWVKVLHQYNDCFICSDEVFSEQEDLNAIYRYFKILCDKWKDIPKSELGEVLDLVYELESQFGLEFGKDIVQFSFEKSFALEEEIPCEIKEKWEAFKSDFIYSESIKEKLTDEKRALQLLVFNIEEFTQVTFESLVAKLILYIRMSATQSPPISVVLSVINCLCSLLKKPFSSRDFVKIQNELNSLGASKVALSLMCDKDTQPEVFNALLKFCVKLLEGGNPNVQKEFYRYFVNVLNSEVFFERLTKLLNSHMDQLAFKNPPEIQKLPSYKKHDRTIKTILRLLQLLCENHNEHLQNYLRFQEKSRNNYDMVAATLLLLEELMKKKYFRSFLVMSQCFDTLTEFIQGPCFANQTAIIDSKFLEMASGILCLDEREDCLQKYGDLVSELTYRSTFTRLNTLDKLDCITGWMASHLKYKCMITILSLLEGRTDNYIITRMARAINPEILKENLLSVYSLHCEVHGADYYEEGIFNHHEDNEAYNITSSENPQDLNPEYYKAIIEIGFMVYFLVKYFQSNEHPESKEFLKSYSSGSGVSEKEVQLQKAFNFFQKNSGSVEVVFNQGTLCKVYFWLPPEAHCLTKEMKESFNLAVDRSSNKSKLQYLQENSEELIEEMQHEAKLSKFLRNYKLLSLITLRIELWKNLSFVLTLVLNFLIVSSYSTYSTHRLTEPSLFYYESQSNQPGLSVSETKNLFRALGILQCVCAGLILSFYVMKKGPVLAKRGWKSKGVQTKFSFSLLDRVVSAFWTVFFIMKNKHVQYHTLYVVFSLLGIVVHPFYFSVHLLGIVYQYPSLQNVIKSVTLQRKALFLTYILTLVLIYLFGVWGYSDFWEFFYEDCESLLMCVMTVLEKGYKHDGGIGGYMKDAEVYNIPRVFFDNMYNIILAIVMTNIFQGIIIDTFAMLREQQEKDKNDMQNNCFICGMNKETIERSTNRSLKFHTLFEHNEWNYLFFICYLRNKETTEYTGIESHVYEKITKKEINWFPQRRALSVTNNEEDEEKHLLETVTQIQAQVGSLKKEVSEIKRSLTNS